LANSKYAKKLKIDGGSSEDDFFIKQPFNLNKKRKNVARFGAIPDVVGFLCYGFPGGSGPSLGVRFVRKKISKSKRKKNEA
jgi:hypothetical protein